MNIRENISLRQFNTFGIDVRSRYFACFSNLAETGEWLDKNARIPKLILGGGSNILLTRNFNGIVLKNEVMGIEEIKEDESFVYVRVGAGENWHRFVLYCLQRNWAGVENLSLIPGNVGAAPMQNIGAYGVELQEVFNSLSAYHIHDKKVHHFTLGDCAFGYRDSIFKKKYKDQYIIQNVTFRLRKHPVFHTAYGAIREELEKMEVKQLSIQAISQAVINIRTAKLPDPAKIGNGGSFFKNPEIPKKKFEALQKQYPAIPHYPVKKYAGSSANGKDAVKLAAGWLIEQCGWKGVRRGDAGVHTLQSLVLVNYGNATGKEIYDLSEEVLRSVQKKFGVLLEREVNIV